MKKKFEIRPDPNPTIYTEEELRQITLRRWLYKQNAATKIVSFQDELDKVKANNKPT